MIKIMVIIIASLIILVGCQTAGKAIDSAKVCCKIGGNIYVDTFDRGQCLKLKGTPDTCRLCCVMKNGVLNPAPTEIEQNNCMASRGTVVDCRTLQQVMI